MEILYNFILMMDDKMKNLIDMVIVFEFWMR